MVPESVLCAAALALNLLALPDPSSSRGVGSTARPGGFQTERLSPKQARLWNAVRGIALAESRNGGPLYPTLNGLWRAVEQSRHLVFIELITDKARASNMAAETAFEEFDPAGRMHSVCVRLFIPTIDRAYAEEQAPRDGLEFVPFTGLSRKARYAKVLGHELAHIERMFRDPYYLRLLRRICREQSAIAAAVRGEDDGSSLPALQERSARVWLLVLESEKPALAAEREIYRELLAYR